MELNKKLAEWAGWTTAFNLDTRQGVNEGVTNYYVNPDGRARDIPNFTQSLDACFKWLVSKGISKLMTCGFSSMTAYTILFDRMRDLIIWEGNPPALALCLAIEKLIDGEVNREGT